LYGGIPSTLGATPGLNLGAAGPTLRGLYLSANKFDGTIPESICNLNGLEALFLDENQLEGSIPDCFVNLINLKQLYLFKNQLTGDLPSELNRLSQLGKF
jgi:Leucine-rich repeat (LRR) protein